MIHENYMKRCLELAKRGAGTVAPNPMVGALLVKDEKIIGEGWHRQYGKAHAEVNAIEDAIQKGHEAEIASSTLYVSLEPCAHHGKTPPCTELIIKYRIPKVVIACRDPFPQVNGKGIEQLKAAGIEVESGILEKEAKELNRRFFLFHTYHRPYIILKWAQSGDGFIAEDPDKRSMISNEYSNRLVHQWRSEEAAILVGTRTAIMDDPSLTTRLWPGSSPVRMVIDLELKLPSSLKLFDGESQTIIINGLRQGQDGKISYYMVNRGMELFPQLFKAMVELNLQSLIVEGGAKLLNSFIDSGNWDEARIITAEKIFHKGLLAPILSKAKKYAETKLGTDRIEYFKNPDPWQ